MSQENIAIVRRFFAEQDEHRGPPPAHLCAADYRAHVVGFPDMDLAGHVQLGKAFYGAFPDLSQRIDDAIADGGRVAVRMTATATHRGPFMGLAPTGKRISISGMATLRIVDGKVAELHEIFDQLGMMEQIGALAHGPSASSGGTA